MNKARKIVSLVLAVIRTGLIGYGEIALTEENVGDNTTQELIELYQKFKESIDKDTTGELVDSSEVYVKLINKKIANIYKDIVLIF